MLEAECELRDDFRDLRVERMQTLTATGRAVL